MMNALVYILIFGVLGLLSASVVYGLWWAIRGGQISNFQRSAASIFDNEESIGLSTDAFPERRKGDTDEHR